MKIRPSVFHEAVACSFFRTAAGTGTSTCVFVCCERTRNSEFKLEETELFDFRGTQEVKSGNWKVRTKMGEISRMNKSKRK